MSLIVESLKNVWSIDLTDEERVRFIEWLHKDYKDFIEFAALGEIERKMWNHYYPRPAEAMGLLSNKLSGDKK